MNFGLLFWVCHKFLPLQTCFSSIRFSQFHLFAVPFTSYNITVEMKPAHENDSFWSEPANISFLTSSTGSFDKIIPGGRENLQILLQLSFAFPRFSVLFTTCSPVYYICQCQRWTRRWYLVGSIWKPLMTTRYMSQSFGRYRNSLFRVLCSVPI